MHLTALDIGSHAIKLIAAEIRKNGDIRVHKIMKAPSEGVRKGTVHDLEDVTASLGVVLQDLRREYRQASKNIFVNVNGPHMGATISKGIIAVSRADSEIYDDDVERVMKASQALNLPANRSIIHTITREFIVDGIRDIADPRGLVGNRLEVESIVVDVFSTYLKNIAKVVEVNGGGVGGFVLGSIASARAALTKKQKELGVALVDIGAHTTNICIYEDDKLLHAAVFPVGSAHITNDLAVGFKVPVYDAESLKLQFGHAIARQIPSKETIGDEAGIRALPESVSRRFMAEIIESRLAEIFEFTAKELKSVGVYGKLPAGVVLSGGGAKLPGTAELAKQGLRGSVQTGIPLGNFRVADKSYEAELEDPEFVCAAGLLLVGAHLQEEPAFPSSGGNSVLSFTKDLFRSLLP